MICKKCTQEVSENVNFCPSCGAGLLNDRSNRNSSLLMVLCILTILGSVFTIIRALLYEAFSEFDRSSEYIRGWIYAASAIGTLTGAIMMIKKQLNGLYLYTIFQIIYLITVIIATFSYGEFGGFAFIISLFFIVPSVLFLILYWTNSVKNNLE
ncbi:MAG: zinc ribbon domain-containing protein [Flavobacteriaceae bacterium]